MMKFEAFTLEPGYKNNCNQWSPPCVGVNYWAEVVVKQNENDIIADNISSCVQLIFEVGNL